MKKGKITRKVQRWGLAFSSKKEAEAKVKEFEAISENSECEFEIERV